MGEHDADGLDPHRYWIYSVITLLPVLLSALPFIKKDMGYQFSGAFCNLPLRPIWYRLALVWIPRWVIALIITFISVYMYAYVDKKFTGFSRTSIDLSLSARSHSTQDSEAQSKQLRKGTFSGHKTTESFDWRRGSSTTISRSLSQNFPKKDSPNDATQAKARSGDPRPLDFAFSRNDFEPLSQTSQVLPQLPDDQRRTSEVTTSSKITSVTEKSSASLAPLKEIPSPDHPYLNPPADSYKCDAHEPPPTHHDTSPAGEAAKRALEAQRLLLQRQLRNNFIYPLIYLAMWTIPLITTCMQFTTKYAMSTPAWLGILGVFSLTGMGAVDCLAFLWKERPWRAVPGSRCCAGFGLCSRWRKSGDERRGSVATASSVSNGERQAEGDIEMQALGEPRRKERPSGTRMRSSDQQRTVRDRALERLALERQDRRTRAFGEELAEGPVDRERVREWWDVRRFSSFGV